MVGLVLPDSIQRALASQKMSLAWFYGGFPFGNQLGTHLIIQLAQFGSHFFIEQRDLRRSKIILLFGSLTRYILGYGTSKRATMPR